MFKIALIGSGFMGQYHAEAYKYIDGVKLVCVFDNNLDSVKKFAKKHNCKPISRFKDLSKEEIDVIDICIPTPYHKNYIMKSAQFINKIICEKPLARTLEDGEAILKICEKEKIKLFVGHVVRFFPEYKKAHQIIKDGKLGKVGIVRTSRCSQFPQRKDNWFENVAMSGGIVLDFLIHDFDFLRWCFGDVKRVYGEGLAFKKIKNAYYALVTIRFKNGVIAHAEGSWMHSKFYYGFEIAGEKGMLEYDSRNAASMNLSMTSKKKGDVNCVSESPVKEDPYTVELRYFIYCIKNNNEPLITPYDAFKALEISLSALESIKTGKPISFY